MLTFRHNCEDTEKVFQETEEFNVVAYDQKLSKERQWSWTKFHIITDHLMAGKYYYISK